MRRVKREEGMGGTSDSEVGRSRSRQVESAQTLQAPWCSLDGAHMLRGVSQLFHTDWTGQDLLVCA